MAEGTATLTDVRNALARAKAQIDKHKSQTTEVVGEVVNTTAAMAGAGLAGFAHQRYGAVDKDTGYKIHRTNGVNSGALLGGLVKFAAGFGVAGEYSKTLSAAGTGPLCGASDQWGRAIQCRLEKMAAERDKKAAEEAKAKSNGAAAPAQATGT